MEPACPDVPEHLERSMDSISLAAGFAVGALIGAGLCWVVMRARSAREIAESDPYLVEGVFEKVEVLGTRAVLP